MEAVPANCLRDLWSRALQACVIGIDEGQFVSINSLNNLGANKQDQDEQH